ncbi:MAG: staygreen family protein [Tissierellia bacterium]|nr:staygreen family protein [Tissierellia bacterium]
MNRLNPEKLYVEFIGVTKTEPIIPRRYTLTHSDITADLYLTIGSDFAYNKLNPMRDEVMGEWIGNANSVVYYVYLYVDGQFIPGIKAIRETIFRRELPLALEAIRYGDNEFFNAHPELDYVPITVYFLSTDPMFNKVENWGTFSDYNIIAAPRLI